MEKTLFYFLVILLLILLFKYWGGFFLISTLSPRFLHRREQLYFFTMLGNLPCCSYSNTLAPVPGPPWQWLVQWSSNSSCQPNQYFCKVCWLFPLHLLPLPPHTSELQETQSGHRIPQLRAHDNENHKSPSSLPPAYLFYDDPTAWILPAMLKMLHTTVALALFFLKLAHFPGLDLVMDPTQVKMKNDIIQH